MYNELMEETPLSYGENPWQKYAKLVAHKSKDQLALGKFHLVSGSSPSYNNICDLDRLLQVITHISAAFDINRNKTLFIAVGGKHGNPCGAAVGHDKLDVLRRMIEGDTRAIFGGLVMVNFPIGGKDAGILLRYKAEGAKRLLDGIIASAFSDDAVSTLKRRGDKCRFFANPALQWISAESRDTSPRFRYVRGGFLRQQNYTFILNLKHSLIEKLGEVSSRQEEDMMLAWAVGSTSNSNTITLVRGGQLIGNGVGQQDRVGCCELAVKRARDAGHSIEGAVAYSDSFFPFTDGPEVLAEAGVSAILASSGSVRDKEVKQFCKERGLALYLIPDKVGRGFFGH